jgi:hypothetical protein
VGQPLTLSLPIGTARDFPFQAINPDGTGAEDIFESGDTLATVVWPGDGLASILTPTTTWIDAPSGMFQISFNDSDTSSLLASTYRIMTTATRSGRSASLLPRGSKLRLVDVPGSSVLTDLVTQDFLAASLAAGGLDLTTAMLELLPAMTRSASRSIRRHCNRYFNRGGPRGTIPAYDGLYAVDWPSKTILLRQYPINAPPRVRTNPTIVLTVWQGDSTTNQQAYYYLETDGTDEDVDDVSPATTGLVLVRVASAVTTKTTLTWASYPTLTQLGAAIVALGASWQVTIENGFQEWPTADFRAGQGSQAALGYQSNVGLSILADDIPCLYNARTGIITLSEQVNDPFTSPRFGMYLQTDVDDVSVYGGPQGVRVQYDAGWDTVPEDVQSAAVETVAHWLYKLSLDQSLSSESDGARSFVVNTAFADYALPKSVLGKLAPYRSPRA